MDARMTAAQKFRRRYACRKRRGYAMKTNLDGHEMRRSRLDRKIVAVAVTLCLLTSVAHLVFSAFRTGGGEDLVSYSSNGQSSTPFNAARRTHGLPANRLGRAEARQILERAGYQEVRRFRSDGAYFRATAVRTFRAPAMTSGPIPSPGSRRILARVTCYVRRPACYVLRRHGAVGPAHVAPST